MSLLAGARPGSPPLVSALKSLMWLSLLVMHHLPQKPLAIFHPLTSLKHVVFASSSSTFFNFTRPGERNGRGHLSFGLSSRKSCMLLLGVHVSVLMCVFVLLHEWEIYYSYELKTSSFQTWEYCASANVWAHSSAMILWIICWSTVNTSAYLCFKMKEISASHAFGFFSPKRLQVRVTDVLSALDLKAS